MTTSHPNRHPLLNTILQLSSQHVRLAFVHQIHYSSLVKRFILKYAHKKKVYTNKNKDHWLVISVFLVIIPNWA